VTHLRRFCLLDIFLLEAELGASKVYRAFVRRAAGCN